jgi:D-serine deaminase-like pyridoxal phosphate-dependent protein
MVAKPMPVRRSPTLVLVPRLRRRAQKILNAWQTTQRQKVSMFPHTKTHKMRALTEMQLEAGGIKIHLQITDAQEL